MAFQNPDVKFETHEQLSLEDCDALLSFPYHQYAPIKIENDEDPGASSSSYNLTIDEKSPEESITDLFEKSEKFMECSKLNVSYQKDICDTLFLLRQAVSTNKSAQKSVTDSLTKQRTMSMKALLRSYNSKPVNLYAAPYFRDNRGRVPPEDKECKRKLKACPVDAYLMPPKPWLASESKKLKDGVADSVLNVALKPLKIKRDHLKSKLKSPNLPESEEPNVTLELENVEFEIEEVQKFELADLFELVGDKIDWMTISATNLEGTRSAEECECMWNNYLSDKINKKPFTYSEDKRLKKLALEFKEKDWDKIAELLNTQRTAIQCFERYQVSLNENFTKSYWTPEEDKHLEATVNRLKIGDYIPWNQVICYIEGRTRQQIINRYERSVSKEIVKTKWSKMEDAMIIACEKILGAKWNQMRRYLPRRSAYGIRERYCNCLDPTLKIGSWTVEEDKVLIHYIKKYGYGKWGKISVHLPGRTDNMCLFRAGRLMYHTKQKVLSELKDNEDDNSMKIVKKLKPFAPSKNCEHLNGKLRGIQKTAFEVLLEVLHKIKPDVEFNADISTCDLSSFPESMLGQIHDELTRMQASESDADEAPTNKKKRRLPNRPPIHKGRKFRTVDECYDISEEEEDDFSEFNHDSKKHESNDEEDLHISTNERICSEEDVAFSKEVLQKRFREVGAIIPLHQAKALTVFSIKEELESKLYLKYLQQEFRVSGVTDKDEEENFVCNGKNLSSGVSELIFRFIQPYSPNSFQVLSPNVATIGAMEVMEESKSRVQLMSGFVKHSHSYLNYLFDEGTEPVCLHCSQKKMCMPANDAPFMKGIQNVLKQKHIVPETRLVKAAAREDSFCDGDDDVCVCDELKESKAAVSLLRRRLLSIFLWPFLLSQTNFNDSHYTFLKDTEFTDLIQLPSQPRKKRQYVKKKKRGVQKGTKRGAFVKKSYGVKVPPASVLKKSKSNDPPVEKIFLTQKRIKLEPNSNEDVQSSNSPGENITPANIVPKEEKSSDCLLQRSHIPESFLIRNTNDQNTSSPENNIKVHFSAPSINDCLKVDQKLFDKSPSSSRKRSSVFENSTKSTVPTRRSKRVCVSVKKSFPVS